jgi:hypothetical protein
LTIGDCQLPDPPSRFVIEWATTLAPRLPAPRRVQAIVVTRYLQRDLFEPIRRAVTPGGLVI